MTGAHCGKILFHLEKSSVVRRVASQRDRSGEDVDDDQTRKARNRWSIHVGVFERFDDQADIAMPDQTAITAGNSYHCCTILTRHSSYLNDPYGLAGV